MLNVAIFMRLLSKGAVRATRAPGTFLVLAQFAGRVLHLEIIPMNNVPGSAAGTKSTREIEAALDDITARGVAGIRDAKAGFDDAVTHVADRGWEALDSAREVRATLADAVLNSIKVRPYTTLALAGAIGFVYGAMRRR
jgi:ElaB/YqjD/DUF883 family membrane-anchored ribosome-binding protein